MFCGERGSDKTEVLSDYITLYQTHIKVLLFSLFFVESEGFLYFLFFLISTLFLFKVELAFILLPFFPFPSANHKVLLLVLSDISYL